MKKILVWINLLLICGILSGCCVSHDWQEATCTIPKTCSKCEKIEGEALGHTWVEATCTEPKTCSTCGETEGEALGHTWIEATCIEPKSCSVCGETEGKALKHKLLEATYQSPATCTVCGAVEGEPLKPYFEEKGLVCGVELNVHYPYVSSCYRNNKILTTGEVFFTDYQVFDSTEEYEALAGYEWRSCIINYIFSDDNAWDYGYVFDAESSDYYTGYINDSPFTINYNGKDYSDCKLEANILENGWNNATKVATARMEVAVRVPIGYDGIVLSTHNCQVINAIKAQKEETELEYIDEIIDDNTVFFRYK